MSEQRTGRNKANALALYLRALRQVRPWWPALGSVLALGLLWIPISLLIPVPVKIVLDNVIGAEPLPAWAGWLPVAPDGDGALMLAVAMTVAVAVVVLTHNTVDWLLREGLSERMVLDMRQRMMLKSLETSALASRPEGSQESSYRIVHDAPALQWVTIYGLGPVITALASIVTLLIVTSRLSVTVAVLALVTSVPAVLLIHLNQRRMCDGWHDVKALDSKGLNGAQEALAAWRVVVIDGQERQVLDRFGRAAWAAYRAKLRVMGLEAALGSLMSLSAAAGTAAILYVSVQNVRAGLLSAGDLILITAYVGQLYGPIQTLGTHISAQQSALASVERSFELVDEAPSIRERPGALPLAAARGDIEFRDVSFGYGPGRTVIGNCSFRVPAGSWVAVSGPTGVGKTTLANLLVRFLDPTEGSVHLDGHDLRDYRLADLRRQFAFLGQEALLISGSIEENIGFARPDAPKPDILRAARLAQAHDFIAALPEGYATTVGEGGIRLSGGERQRVALARAYLKDAPILVLDEPTSALDSATEREVIADLKRNLPDRTVFVITHRPSILAAADLVLRVENGRVAVSGPLEAEPPAAADLLLA